MAFPIHRRVYRRPAADYRGEVFVVDVDRTYLDTRFNSLRGIARIPFETAFDKRALPGMSALLRDIRRGDELADGGVPLYFVSASPSQLRGVIERKIMLDGIGFDGATFKDWASVLRSGTPRRLREQVGFKMTALLRARIDLPVGAREVLIGDDVESDPVTFSLYADALARRIAPSRLYLMLRRFGVGEDDARDILELLSLVPQDCRGVEHIYIRAERSTSPEALRVFPGVTVCRSSLQLASALWSRGSLPQRAVQRALIDARRRDQGDARVRDDLCDAVARGLVERARIEPLCEVFGPEGLAADLMTVPEPAAPPTLDNSSMRPWTPEELETPRPQVPPTPRATKRGRGRRASGRRDAAGTTSGTTAADTTGAAQALSSDDTPAAGERRGRRRVGR